MTARFSSRILDPADDEWSSTLRGLAHDVYDTAVYATIEGERLHGRAIAFAIEDGPLRFFLPLLLTEDRIGNDATGTVVRDAASPYGYPGIVLSPAALESEGFPDACLDVVVAELRAMGVCSAFIRLHPLLNADLRCLLRRHRPTDSGVTVSMDLRPDKVGMWAALRKGHASAVNKARRAGYEVEIVSAQEQFDAFCAVYEDTLARLGASSEYRFSRDYLLRLASIDGGHVAVATLDARTAGAYLFFEQNGIIQMHLGGTLSEFMHPSPSHLLIYAVAMWGKERGDVLLHLGGGVGGSATDSLFTFKSGFSPRRHRYLTLRLVVDPARYEELVRRCMPVAGAAGDLGGATAYFPAYRAER